MASAEQVDAPGCDGDAVGGWGVVVGVHYG